MELSACQMPFEFGEISFSQCILDEDLDTHKCVWNTNVTDLANEGGQSWAICNGGCFNSEGGKDV